MRRPSKHNTTNLDLDRMTLMLDLLGQPQQSFRVIHVTGTNGKGSISRMAESLCRASGMRTGLFTSPHLERITERIIIDGEPVSDEHFVEIYDQVIDYVNLVDQQMDQRGRARMSFFEVLTTMAIAAFADAPVDIAIVEVGMGGSWDATNVLDGDVAILGPIDMDHMQWLGNTVEQIAQEKVGIIKPHSTVIVQRQPHADAVLPIIEQTARANQATLYYEGEDIDVESRLVAVGGQMVSLRTPQGLYEEVPISKFGKHQASNALVALSAAEVILPISTTISSEVITEAFTSLNIPGRIEMVRTSPCILIDGAHNLNAAHALRETLEETFEFKQLVAVVAMMADKQIESFLGELEPIVDHMVITENSWRERVMPADELAKIAIEIFGEDRVSVEPALPDAIQRAVDLVDSQDEQGIGYGHGIIICGSFVTAGDARGMLVSHRFHDVAGNAVKAALDGHQVLPSHNDASHAADAASVDGVTGSDYSSTLYQTQDADDIADDAGVEMITDADEDFETDANIDFDENDFGDFDISGKQLMQRIEQLRNEQHLQDDDDASMMQ